MKTNNSYSSTKPFIQARHEIDSDYHDYSSLMFRADFNPHYNRRLYQTGGYGNQFPEKIYCMLEDASRAGLNNIIAWKSHGRAFCVHDIPGFVELILPKYFKQSKWTSFQRQLNKYGFKRISKGVDTGSYYHELFLRGIPTLSLDIQRKNIKGSDSADFKPDPDFYKMPNVGIFPTIANGAKILTNSITAKTLKRGRINNDCTSLNEREVNFSKCPKIKDSAVSDSTKIVKNTLQSLKKSMSKQVKKYTEADILQDLEMPSIDLASGFFISSDDKVEEVLLKITPDTKNADENNDNFDEMDEHFFTIPNVKVSTHTSIAKTINNNIFTNKDHVVCSEQIYQNSKSDVLEDLEMLSVEELRDLVTFNFL